MPSTHELSGKLLPIHFGPKEDELLSSWLCRLALVHGLTSISFCASVLPQRHPTQLIGMQDIDSYTGKEILTTLAEKTGITSARVASTTLATYEGYLFEGRSPKAWNQWIMPVKLQPHGMKYGLQYCPLCLDTNEPYYRRLWRLVFITLCTKHHVQLLDRCKQCDAPVSFIKAISNGRFAPPSDRLTCCYSCKADLRDVQPEQVNTKVQAGKDEISFQVRLETALQEGWIEMPGGGMGYTLLYFPVLNRLMKLFAMGRFAPSLRADLSRKRGISMSNVTFTRQVPCLTQLGVTERRGLLGMARQLLSNWPKDFIDFCKDNRVPSYYLLEGRSPLPFWFLEVTNEKIRHPLYIPPKEEIESAIRCFKKLKRQYRWSVKRENLRLPSPSHKEIKAVYSFLTSQSSLKRRLRKSHGLVGADRQYILSKPRRMSNTLWKNVELVIRSRQRRFRMESGERRKLLNGVLYVLKTGCPWVIMPTEFGSHTRAKSMYNHLKCTGLFTQIWELCSDLYDD